MNLGAGLYQQQSLKLAMTKELTQAIALLQYSSQELGAFLEEKALENPLIDLQENHFAPYSFKTTRGTGAKGEIEGYAIRDSESLNEHLCSQIAYLPISSPDKKILEYIVFLLDDNGYLRDSAEEIAAKLAISIEEAESAILQIQALDPAGVGARSLQECLHIQLKQLPERNYIAEAIISDYFVWFAEKQWPKISKELGIPIQEIQSVLDTVKLLKPRPGLDYQKEPSPYVVPDLQIVKDEEDFKVILTEDAHPNISLNLHYYRNLKKHQAQLNAYLNERLAEYQWIIKSLDQRRQTLVGVMQVIMDKQIDFFAKGPAFLKPLTMKEVADELSIHESTVSRAAREKYVQTPYGVFQLKHFFSSKTQTGDVSSHKVKNLISKAIEAENKLKPLSDQQLVDMLQKDHGIEVSRRTIAKYRDQLSIPSSSKRKRYV